MPRRPPSPPPPSPFDVFFDRIVDSVVERVEDIITPVLEDLSEEIAETVENQVNRAAAAQSTPRSHPPHRDNFIPRPPRPRRTRTRTRQQPHPRSTYPPPPPTRPSAPETLYDVLQVARTAEFETIRAAHRALSALYHPDKRPGDKGAEERMKRINVAWEVLKDAGKRREYDRTIGH